MIEEMEKFVKEGPSLTELNDAKQAFLEGQKCTGDGPIASQIVSNLNLGRNFALRRKGEGSRASRPRDHLFAFLKCVDRRN